MSEAASEDLIIADGVGRKYPPVKDAEAVRALRKVSFRVRRGSCVAIRGDSGSGKSTLLNLLGGLDAPTSGELTVDGHDLARMSDRDLAGYRASTVGFVFQTFNLLPQLSARENVELPMEALYVPAPERKQRAEQLLAAVGMSERSRHRPGRLSGGEQQRVAIARALANRPSLVLADEPTGNLDRRSRRAVVALLARVNREMGATLVIVTHDPNVSDACDVVHVLKRGQLKNEYRPDPRRAQELREPPPPPAAKPAGQKEDDDADDTDDDVDDDRT